MRRETPRVEISRAARFIECEIGLQEPCARIGTFHDISAVISHDLGPFLVVLDESICRPRLLDELVRSHGTRFRYQIRLEFRLDYREE